MPFFRKNITGKGKADSSPDTAIDNSMPTRLNDLQSEVNQLLNVLCSITNNLITSCRFMEPVVEQQLELKQYDKRYITKFLPNEKKEGSSWVCKLDECTFSAFFNYASGGDRDQPAADTIATLGEIVQGKKPDQFNIFSDPVFKETFIQLTGLIGNMNNILDKLNKIPKNFIQKENLDELQLFIQLANNYFNYIKDNLIPSFNQYWAKNQTQFPEKKTSNVNDLLQMMQDLVKKIDLQFNVISDGLDSFCQQQKAELDKDRKNESKKMK